MHGAKANEVMGKHIHKNCLNWAENIFQNA